MGKIIAGVADPDHQGEVGFCYTMGPVKNMYGTKWVPLFTSLPDCNCGWTDSATPSEKDMVNFGEDGLSLLRWYPRVNGGGENKHQLWALKALALLRRSHWGL